MHSRRICFIPHAISNTNLRLFIKSYSTCSGKCINLHLTTNTHQSFLLVRLATHVRTQTQDSLNKIGHYITSYNNETNEIMAYVKNINSPFVSGLFSFIISFYIHPFLSLLQVFPLLVGTEDGENRQWW